MRYLLLICLDPAITPSAEQAAAIGPATDAWVAEMDGRGIRIEGSQLAATAEARTLRRRDGEVLVIDGPFAETKEVVAGYDLIECTDLDEAIEVAGKHPGAGIGAVEIRPLFGAAPGGTGAD